MASHYSQYGRIFDLLDEMIFILARDGSIVDLNKRATEEFGIVSSATPKAFLRTFVSPEFQTSFQDILANANGRTKFESRFVKPDRSVIDASVEVRIMDSENGPYTVIIAKDVTEQKKKELDLLRYSNVIHFTINPIQITDAKGNMVYVNPAFEAVTGYRSDELIGKNPRILSSGKHDRVFWREVWNTISSGREWVGRLENRRKDGSPFYSELVISPIVDQNGAVAGFLGAHRDITEQKFLEQQLVRSQKMESIGTLAAGIAHEVGNPLTAISSLVQVIQRTTQDVFAKEKLDLINSQINRITRIIRELVDFSRPSTHIVKMADVNQVIRDAMNIVQYGKHVKDIEFSVDLGDKLPSIQVVPDQVVQVFINILMNAVDAIDGKPGTIYLQSRLKGRMVEVTIRDTGKGIDPEDREKIFEPFYTTKEIGRGTGLGLWVSYGIVKNFGGNIIVESKPGEGSTFVVFLPTKGD
ncbi:MAG: PAS domain S-box protein [Bacteroidota bacterium]